MEGAEASEKINDYLLWLEFVVTVLLTQAGWFNYEMWG
jgi:amino acid transporter